MRASLELAILMGLVGRYALGGDGAEMGWCAAVAICNGT
jgi:hypothetical protein